MSFRGWAARNPAIVFSVVGTTALCVVGFVVGARRTRQKNENGPGQIERVVLVEGEGGRSGVVLVESVEHSSEESSWKEWRLSHVDPRTGALLARKVTERGMLACAAARAGRIWCVRDGAPELRDAFTLDVVADTAKLRATTPSLAAGIHQGTSARVDRVTRGLELTTNDGYKVRIDPVTLAAQSVNEASNAKSESIAASQTATQSSVRVSPSLQYQFDGSPRAGLVRLEWQESSSKKSKVGVETFIQPRFIVDEAQAPISVGEPPALVITHDSSLDQTTKKSSFTALRPTGEAVWEATSAHGTVLGAKRFGDVVVIVLGPIAHTVVGIDAANGNVRYRYDGTRN